MKLIIININSLILISYKVFVFDRLERKNMAYPERFP